jgi:cellulose biosynthesis protein BcsQ
VAAKVVTVVNMKGGVGKTTTVIALAETLAAMDNASVLVIDLDTQASASYSIVGDRLLTDLIEADRTVDTYFDASLIHKQPIPLMDLVQQNASSITHLSERALPVSLLASSVNLRITEREIIHHLTKSGFSMTAIEGQATKRLGTDIKSISRIFDYIILDCAPGISAFTAAAVTLAELVIVPTIPDFLSIYGMQAFVRRVFPELVSGDRARRREPHVLVSRKRASREQDAYLKFLRDFAKKKDSGFSLFETIIPDDPAVSAAVGKRDQTYSQKYPLPISGWYANLTDEVKAVLQ